MFTFPPALFAAFATRIAGVTYPTTVANGKVLMKDRRLTEIDEAKVMADCRQAAAELGKRINSR